MAYNILINELDKICLEYGVRLINITFNIQNSADIEIDERPKETPKAFDNLEEELREKMNEMGFTMNDLFYKVYK